MARRLKNGPRDRVARHLSRKGQPVSETHRRDALPIETPGASDRGYRDIQEYAVAGDLVRLCRVRNQILTAKLRFSNQLAAIERLRTGELKGKAKTKAKRQPTIDDVAVALATQGHLAPFLKPLDQLLKQQNKEIAALAVKLLVWPFVESIRGCGALGLGLIIGATGDLFNYANPGKLWKRMGLALVGDQRQRKIADAEQAVLHGYNPRRRALMHVIGDSLIKQNGRDGYYRVVYDARKTHTETMHPEWTKGHRHMDAMRYMEKRLLRHMWQVWRKQATVSAYTDKVVPAELDAEAGVQMLPVGALPQRPTDLPSMAVVH